MKPARFYKSAGQSRIRCCLCHHNCLVGPNQVGFCQVRKNIDGGFYSLNYGKVIAQQIDPIEKKPLSFFMPGTKTYSLACWGCNFRCRYCQNATIAQVRSRQALIDNTPETAPAAVVQAALANGCPSISYTYTEPTVFAEFALATMALAKQAKLKNIWVSNGYLAADLLIELEPLLDAINVDLKFFNDNSYQKFCGARLQPVLDNIIKLKQSGVHLEITTLIIPNINDSPTELKQIAHFISDRLGSNTPWHISAFYPAHLMSDFKPTPAATIFAAREIGQSCGLTKVVPGNI
ncbi:MAG TPA: AmmeMemoRadiSam system radical SAM enzyme [bacterium]|nr:AmmeMemoRadiSam system radical SAM enzyme [bacterium]